MTAVLLVSGGGFQGLGLLEALQRLPGVRPMIADIHAESVTRYLCSDYFVVPPLSDQAAFAAALLALVRQHHIAAVIPSTAYELPLLARMRDALEAENASVAVSSVELLDVLLDKHRTAEFLARHGIACQLEINPRQHDFTAPLFGRPISGWGGRDTRVLKTAADRDHAAACGELDTRTWSVLLEDFDEYSADFAVDASHNLSTLVLRRRLRTSGGFAVISESVCEPTLESLANHVATAIAVHGGRGFFNVQLIHPTDGSPALVSDVNPRFGTSSGHALSEGVNLAAFFLGIAPSENVPTRRPAKTIRRLQDLAVQSLPTRPLAVVFDLDDTLIDHKQWFARKALHAYQSVAVQWTAREDFLLAALALIDEGERQYFIDRLGERFDWSVNQHGDYLAAFREARVDTPVYRDVLPCLSALRAMGLKLAVLTDNPPSTQQQKLDGAQGLDAFDAVVFARETGAEKPDPRAFNAVAQTLGLPPSALCMIGDNLFRDCLGALRAGYGSAILLRRPGAFLQPHAGLADFMTLAQDDRLAHAPDLVVAREILLSS